MNLVKLISTSYDNATKRLVKFYRNGKDDVQTSIESGPYGTDANPIKDMIGVYAATGVKGETVLLGYLNKNQLAEPGEHRLYSTNAQGSLQTYVWLKGNGDILLGGDAYHLTRYEQLKTGFDQLKQDFNTLITLYNAHVHPIGSPSTGPTPAVGTASTADISQSKADTLKTL